MSGPAHNPSGEASPLLQAGSNCWRVEQAERFAFIVDADDYFTAVRAAMLKARHSIFLIGWDFDARISLGEPQDDGPNRLGDFFLWLVRSKPQLAIRVLRWDTGAFKAMFRGSTLLTILRWKTHPRITLKLDGAHPVAASHHQKIVVIDDCLAFCGGIDITCERWDRRAHADDEPARVDFSGRPYQPWHDATSAFDGAAARAMGELARLRWQAAGGQPVEPVRESLDCWPEMLRPDFTQVRLGIARTQPEMQDSAGIHEIEQAYSDLIARARHMIYAESQYFASHRIAHAIARRLQEANGPEIVIINPQGSEGWLEPIAMDSARARLIEALQRIDRYQRLRIYHPHTARGQPIYVHAKVVIVDDVWLRVGSSNLNNRSMRLDTECDVVVSADEAGNGQVRATIARLRNELLAEHLGVTAEEVAARLEETSSLIATIESLRGPGRSLDNYRLPELSDTVKWLADNEILDPDGPDQIFEALNKRGLFKRWRPSWRPRR